MRNFINKIGCKMSFENGISEEQIKERLSWMGNIEDWRELPNNNNEEFN